MTLVTSTFSTRTASTAYKQNRAQLQKTLIATKYDNLSLSLRMASTPNSPAASAARLFSAVQFYLRMDTLESFQLSRATCLRKSSESVYHKSNHHCRSCALFISSPLSGSHRACNMQRKILRMTPQLFIRQLHGIMNGKYRQVNRAHQTRRHFIGPG